jgi:DNA-binding NtrC family response regulator
LEKLLIIGEGIDQQGQLQRMIEREGFEVLEVNGTAQGLTEVARHRPDVVIVNEPAGSDSGVELLKEVQRAHTGAEVVLVTNGGEMSTAIEVLRVGALDYLRRPVNAEQLRIALGRARERRSLRQPTGSVSILVLEDHEPTLRRLVRVLEKEGYQVESAEDGEAGLELFAKQRFDLILADVRMPRQSGIDVLRRTKGAGADVEVIVTTGYGNEELVVEALRQGAHNFLRKPIDIEHMLLAIQKALDAQTVRRSLAYRNRDVELMQQLVVRLTRSLELVVETPWQMSAEARGFLHRLVDALPFGIVVVSPTREVLFANRHVVDKTGATPKRLDPVWLKKMGLPRLEEDQLSTSFASILTAAPGTITTMAQSRWSFLLMTPLRLLRPDGGERYVALAIRGERGEDQGVT